MVRLCVGGAHFVCARSTLMRHADSFFAKLLNGALPSQRVEGGAFFIDRDGTHFRYILNYLRDGSVYLPPGDHQFRFELLQEANFYQLEPLRALLAHPGPQETPRGRSKVLHVLPSMGSVTNYALSWDANLKTIQQCQLEAQRETDDMVEFVQLSNDCSLSFPLSSSAQKGSSDKRVNRWFNTRLPLWRRVRELEREGFRLHHIQSHSEGGIEYLVMSWDGECSPPQGRGGDGGGPALVRLRDQLAQLQGEVADQTVSRRRLEEMVAELTVARQTTEAAPSAESGAEETAARAALAARAEALCCDWGAE